MSRVLIAPLDWGIGHATRCFPIITYLINHNIEVIVAGEGKVAAMLKEAFPGIKVLPLKGYRIRYSRSKTLFALTIVAQLPKIILAICRERKWLQTVIAENKINAVISDNRFGLYSKKIPCVYITHQLHIKSGFGFSDVILQKFNYFFINRYSECWVPDEEGSDNLAGELSHPLSLPSVPVKYLGVLSRFKKAEQPVQYAAAIILSGPEPQRTIFENIILSQLSSIEKRVIIVRGLPDEKTLLKHNLPNLTAFNHLNADELSSVMQQSETVIARSGYSTIMDLIAIQKKSILVPTPGQTEQEYLAKYLSEKQLCISVSQDQFDLKDALKRTTSFVYQIPYNKGMNNTVLSEWIKQFI